MEYRLKEGEKIPSSLTEEEKALRDTILRTRTEIIHLELLLFEARSACKHDLRYETDSFFHTRVYCAVCNREL